MNPEAALKRVVAGCKKAFTAVALFSLAINLLMLTVPIYMMQMYDRVIASGNVDTLVLLTIIALAGLLAMALVEMMRSRMMVRLGGWVDRSLSGPVLAGGMNDSLRAGGLTGASGLRELNTLRGFLTGAGVFPLLDAPWVPIFVAIIFLIHPWLGWLAIVGAIVVFLFALANDMKTRAPLKQANAAATRALYRADSMVRNADVAAAMGMEPHLVRRWRDTNEEGLGLQALASDRAGAISALAKYVRLALQIGMLGLGAYLVTRHELTGGGMIAASIILSRAMAPIEQSINAWRGAVAAKGAYDNVKALLSRTPATGDAMSLPRPSGQISIEGVAFVPPGSAEPVLRGVSLDVEAGECIGLIGASASGKTTLSRILVGSWRPSAGHARMDGADVFVWEAADRGRYIGYLPQDVELFDGSVRDNIARMDNPDADAVIAAAQMAGVHELILRLPNGYETIIGDGGAKLSGGQRQRIALARALYGDPALVVLDEPNSNLDTEGERALMEALEALKERGVTTIVVAHRPSVLASVDRLVVMHNGRVEMQGPRDEVLAKVAAGSIEAVRRAQLERPAKPKAANDAPAEQDAQLDAQQAVEEPQGPAPQPPTSTGEPTVFRIRPGAASRNTGQAAATDVEDVKDETATMADDADDADDAVSVDDIATQEDGVDQESEVEAATGADSKVVEGTVDAPPPPTKAESEEEGLDALFSRITAQGGRPSPTAQDSMPTPAAPASDDVRRTETDAAPEAEPPPADADLRPRAQRQRSRRVEAEGQAELALEPASASAEPAPAPPEPTAAVLNWPTSNRPPRRRDHRALRRSPTTPGRLFPFPTPTLTGAAVGRRFEPRSRRKGA